MRIISALLVLLLGLSVTACQLGPLTPEDELIKKDSLIYLKESDTLFSGRVVAYYEDTGNIRHKGYYSKGLDDGQWTYYRQNGTIDYTAQYKDGKRDGVWRYYAPDGQKIQENRYVNGELNGASRTWHPGGSMHLKTESIYENGLRSGVAKKWYADGVLRTETSYLLGRNHGFERHYDRKGELVHEVFYDKGNVVDADGNILEAYDPSQNNTEGISISPENLSGESTGLPEGLSIETIEGPAVTVGGKN